MIYKNKLTGEEVTILEETDQFYKLSTGAEILKNMFIQSYIPAEMPDITQKEELSKQVSENLNSLKNPTSDKIDPNDFFNNPAKYNRLVDKLNKINSGSEQTQDSSETIIKSSDGVFREQSMEERIEEVRQRNAALLEKYGNKDGVQKTKEESEEEQRRSDMALLNGQSAAESEIKPASKDPVKSQTKNTQPIQPTFNTNDVLSTFMKSFKNNYKVNLKLSIGEKIVEPDFIKMISNNLEGDIIQYYTDLFLDKLLYDTDSLKEIIYKQLYKEVYGKEYVKEEEPEEVESFKISSDEDSKEDSNKDSEESDLIEGKPTKTGQKTYYFINEKGQCKAYILKTAKNKGYKPAKKEDIK